MRSLHPWRFGSSSMLRAPIDGLLTLKWFLCGLFFMLDGKVEVGMKHYQSLSKLGQIEFIFVRLLEMWYDSSLEITYDFFWWVQNHHLKSTSSYAGLMPNEWRFKYSPFSKSASTNQKDAVCVPWCCCAEVDFGTTQSWTGAAMVLLSIWIPCPETSATRTSS
jgi:hypothetical protein